MNNIDILEEKIKIIESLCTDDCINKETVIKPLKYAISTLIAENKELKEENARLKNKNSFDIYKMGQESQRSRIERDYIPKSKIKAKIEIRKEEKENCKDSIEEKYLLREIYVLQSLLEKE